MKRRTVNAVPQQGLVERSFPLDWTNYYEFSLAECDEIEAATEELHARCLDVVAAVCKSDKLMERLGIPKEFHGYVRRSWERRDPIVYGRFDFGYDGRSPPKMFEYNPDTPTTLIESAITQWQWFETHFAERAGYNQFSPLHEMLIARWQKLAPLMAKGTPLYFLTMKNSIEEFATVEYLRDTAHQAGITTEFTYIEDLGWDTGRKRFVDLDDRSVDYVFKLYPWEWMMREEFGKHLLEAENDTGFIEPAWKAILSNKGILPILWEMFPGHPNLLPSYWEYDHRLGDNFVEKPLGGRGGENIRIVSTPERAAETGGTYGDEPTVFQALYPLPQLDGKYFTVGSWIVGGKSAGIVVREDTQPIIVDQSPLVPHLFVE